MLIKRILKWPYKKYIHWAIRKHLKKIEKEQCVLRSNELKDFNPFTILQFYLIFLTLFIITGGIILGIIIICKGA